MCIRYPTYTGIRLSTWRWLSFFLPLSTSCENLVRGVYLDTVCLRSFEQSHFHSILVHSVAPPPPPTHRGYQKCWFEKRGAAVATVARRPSVPLNLVSSLCYCEMVERHPFLFLSRTLLVHSSLRRTGTFPWHIYAIRSLFLRGQPDYKAALSFYFPAVKRAAWFSTTLTLSHAPFSLPPSLFIPHFLSIPFALLLTIWKRELPSAVP